MERARGHELLAARRFAEARDELERALGEREDPEVLVDLATACRVLDDARAATAALERAYRLHLDAADVSAAAMDALALADVAVDQLGAVSVARGWLSRAAQHLAPTPEDPALVHVAGLEAYVALAYDKDPAAARAHAELSVRLAARLGDATSVVMGNAYLGLVRVSLGDLDAGMRLLEAGATAASAGELPTARGLDAYCLLLTACERVRDVERVHEWAARVLTLAEQEGSDAFAGFARTRYAHALLARGEWDAAETELARVLRDSEHRPVTASVGLVLRSRLLRLRGRLDEADAVLATAEREPYRRAVRHLVVESRAALELARGDALAAADLAARYLRMVPPTDVVERVDALETLVRARLALGEPDQAGLAADELAVTASLVPTPGVRGAALLADGLVRTATDPAEAVGPLQDAVDELDRAGMAHDATGARVALAEALCATGRTATARREAELALGGSVRLGAAPLVSRARRVLSSLRAAPAAPGDLTPRELEVLRLAAAGLTNAEIADRLVLSVRTVERHLSNIYLKVGATGSAARTVAIAHGRAEGVL